MTIESYVQLAGLWKMIDMTINLGNVITLIGMLVVLITFGANVKASITNLDARVAKMEAKLDNQNVILIEMARYDGRLAVLEQRIDFALNVRPVHVSKNLVERT
jgi:hypothetical protein